MKEKLLEDIINNNNNNYNNYNNNKKVDHQGNHFSIKNLLKF